MMKEDEVKDDVIRQDHKYVMAERLCRNLLEKGLINQGEFDRIMAKNRDNFSPVDQRGSSGVFFLERCSRSSL